jgi:hypothetical protein
VTRDVRAPLWREVFELLRGGEEVPLATVEAAANAALYEGCWSESLCWSALGSLRDSRDWPVVRAATSIANDAGPEAAASLLLANSPAGRGANFRFALAYFASRLGDWSYYHQLLDEVGEQEERVDLRYLVEGFRYLVDQKQPGRALKFFRTHEGVLRTASWAILAVLRHATRAAGMDSDVVRALVDWRWSYAEAASDDEKLWLQVYAGLMERGAPTNVDIGEFPEFARVFPLRVAVAHARALADSGKWSTAQEVGACILGARAAGRPFSYVRIGDGEGRYVADLEPWPSLQELSLRTAQRVWFWNSTAPPDGSFKARVRNALLGSDFLGVTPLYRVERMVNEGVLGSVGIVLGNAFAVEHLSELPGVCANWVNVELNEQGFYERLGGKVNFISPYPEIGEVFRSRGATADSIDVFVVPSENHPALVTRSLDRPHYPDVFAECLDFIRARPGETFLVAAGLLGKVYCDEAKAAGGVSIDIGSIADMWMGIRTR